MGQPLRPLDRGMYRLVTAGATEQFSIVATCMHFFGAHSYTFCTPALLSRVPNPGALRTGPVTII